MGRSARGERARECVSKYVCVCFFFVSFRFVFLFEFFSFFFSFPPFFWPASPPDRFCGSTNGHAGGRLVAGGARSPVGIAPVEWGGGSATGRGHGRLARRRAVQFNVRHRLRSCSM